MDDKDRKELKLKIIETIAQTEKDIIRLEEATEPISPENSLGRITRMDAINNKSVAEASLRASQKKLATLKMALLKIDSTDFGACSRCGNPIKPARLMYMPQSDKCIRCADRG